MRDPADVPVLLLIFNRPDQVRGLVENLRQVKPRRIYVSADGPRLNHLTDADQVAAAREALRGIDWPCRLETRFSDSNQGCRYGPTNGITWFFEHNSEGIILEDDIRFDPSFFRFCSELLERYRGDTSIGSISGHSFPFLSNHDRLCFRSRFHGIWGWASWSDRWICGQQVIGSHTCDEAQGATPFFWLERRHDIRRMEQVVAAALASDDVWDVLWLYANMVLGRSGIWPCQTFTENSGFSSDSTHTSKMPSNLVARLDVGSERAWNSICEAPANDRFDHAIFDNVFRSPTLCERFTSLILQPSQWTMKFQRLARYATHQQTRL